MACARVGWSRVGILLVEVQILTSPAGHDRSDAWLRAESSACAALAFGFSTVIDVAPLRVAGAAVRAIGRLE